MSLPHSKPSSRATLGQIRSEQREEVLGVAADQRAGQGHHVTGSHRSASRHAIDWAASSLFCSWHSSTIR